jgi:very-short-patch-repair endonuclease
MRIDESTWSSLLSAQQGVITRRQALACGWNARAVEHRLGQEWQRLLPGVYLTATGRASRSQLVWAGLAHAGPGSALTSWTGLEEWAVPHDARADVHVALPHTRRRAGPAFLVCDGRIVLHRTTRSLKERRTIPTLPVERCVVDACLELKRLVPVRALVSTVVQGGRTTVEKLLAELEAAPQRGSGLLRRALAEVADGARSAPEATLLTALRRVELPTYRMNADVFDEEGRWLARADLVVESVKLIAEVDGQRWHLSPENWVADVERHTRLEASGWTVLRYPAARVLADADGVAAEIAAVSRRLLAGELRRGA